jgi:outer membrane lipoprotein-sorting protein
LEQFDALPDHYYVLTLLRGAGSSLEIERKIWFDRADLHVSRVEIYGPAGRLDADIAYSDWQPTGDAAATTTAAAITTATATATTTTTAGAGLLFPREIVIRRPQQDYQLTVDITKLALNAEVQADRFVLAQPSGSKLVRVGEDDAQETTGGQPAGGQK